MLYCGSKLKLEHNEKAIFLFNEMALIKFVSNVWIINNLLLCCMNFMMLNEIHFVTYSIMLVF